MSLRGQDIICLATHYWDERRFRKQEFMGRFARTNRVLYVEPSFSMARLPEPHLRTVAGNRFLVPRVKRCCANLHVLTPPRGLPRWTAAPVEHVNYRWFARIVANAAAELGLRDAILWIYRPAFADVLASIPHRRLVFDLVDDLAAYGGAGSQVERQVLRLVRSSDLLVVTAKPLLERYGPEARRVEQVANGFRRELFAPTGADRQVPNDLAGLPRPILGFVGTIFAFLDFELLERVARSHTDKSLVLLGPVEASAAAALTELARLPNVHHIPGRPQTEIPRYVEAFDVCLNVFREGRVTKSINPLKVYEYLAMGRPVVSTPMQALRMESAGTAIVFAGDATAFCAAIDRCLSPAVQADTAARRLAAAPYSWERLFAQLDAVCGDALG
jgi:glycosyltransferase involved in cell wall biosynthesis